MFHLVWLFCAILYDHTPTKNNNNCFTLAQIPIQPSAFDILGTQNTMRTSITMKLAR
jgi:hypothetical protein